MARGRGTFCDLGRQLSGAISLGVEAGLTAIDAIQQEAALGTEWIHSVDDHGLWHTDV
jgi:hypothetical protein